jgi:hypothetical protein
VHRLVATSASGNERDLIFHGSVCADDVVRIGVDFDQIAKRGLQAGDGFENDILGGIDEFFHVWGAGDLEEQVTRILMNKREKKME